jgi:hypothetical protein
LFAMMKALVQNPQSRIQVDEAKSWTIFSFNLSWPCVVPQTVFCSNSIFIFFTFIFSKVFSLL